MAKAKIMRSRIWGFTLLAFIGLKTQAQDFHRIENAAVVVNNSVLPNPFAGGLNTPQFSAVDLNNDGRLDLYAFDRVGDIHLTFIAQDTPDVGQRYHFSPEYAQNFPHVENWVLLRDYDGDGIMDLFAYPDVQVAGIMVYKGYYDNNNRLAFTRYQFHNSLGLNIATFPLQGGGISQIYVSNIDYPAIDDLDCDGDLDVLTFNLAGGYVELYANRSIEMGYGRDSLIFQWTENCWGGFFESGISNTVDLTPNLGGCYPNLTDDPILEERHTGSTLLTFDGDGDGDKELILGDLSFDKINYLTNGGTCQEAWITNQDPNFPSYDVSADVATFPVAFYLDINGDNRRDLMVCPNIKQAGEDKNCVWWYKNNGTDGQPEFEFQQTDFLVDGMIDFGSGARPVLVDVNADGLLDIVVGNNSIYQAFGAKDPRIFLFENQGTLDEPHWVLTNDDYLNMNQFAQVAFNFAPAFGDLDDDGDADVLIGEQNGHLFYAENLAGPGQPFQFGSISYNYAAINVGQASTPFIMDLNRDGLSDLLVGERNGNINYFPNVGTATNPQFGADPSVAPNAFFFGQVDTRIPGYSTGHSSPVVLLLNNQYVLFTGSEIGRLESYIINENDPNTLFQNITENWGNIQEGSRTHLTFGDLNNDGWLDVLVGNFRGGLGLFSTDIPVESITAVKEPGKHSVQNLKIFPNPTAGTTTVVWPGEGQPEYVEIFTSTGVLIQRKNWEGGRNLNLDLGDWTAGIYLIRSVANGQTAIATLIVK